MKQFEEIYAEYYKPVYRLAMRFLHNHDNASDISQDVFIQLYSSLKRNNEIRSEKAWLFKVTSNLCLSFLKKNEKINGFEAEKLMGTPVAEQQHSIVLEALQKLNAKDRMLLTLYDDGLSYKELAEVTGIKYTSVGKTLSRALNRLKDEVEKKRRVFDR